MKTILIFGSAGMIGHVVYNYLDSLGKYKLFSSSSNKKISDETCLLDIRNHENVKDYLLSIKPDYVINCAGLLIDDAEKNIEDTILINSLFPNVLSRLGKKLNFKLIQISTDCVFSGSTGNYSEDSIQDGCSAYARTKTLGEINNNRDLTIRTSTIGPELKLDGVGLLNWFLNQKGEIFGFDKTYWSGVTTLELAKAIEILITNEITGLYNLTSDEKISKYDLLNLIKEVWRKKNIIVKRNSDGKSDKSLCSIRTDFKYEVIGYKKMLIELYEWMQKHNLYQHYF